MQAVMTTTKKKRTGLVLEFDQSRNTAGQTNRDQ